MLPELLKNNFLVAVAAGMACGAIINRALIKLDRDYVEIQSVQSVSKHLKGGTLWNWPDYFCNAFDNFFGERILSRKFLCVSIMISLISVLIIFILFSISGFFDIRVMDDIAFTEILFVIFCVNLLCD